MIVKDEEGRERELLIGDLVSVRRTGGGEAFAARVTGIHTSARGSIAVRYVVPGRDYADCDSIEHIIWLSSEPPDDDKGLPLGQRHANLKRNLARARDRCEYGGSDSCWRNS
jgi:hypothetical protein